MATTASLTVVRLWVMMFELGIGHGDNGEPDRGVSMGDDGRFWRALFKKSIAGPLQPFR